MKILYNNYILISKISQEAKTTITFVMAVSVCIKK